MTSSRDAARSPLVSLPTIAKFVPDLRRLVLLALAVWVVSTVLKVVLTPDVTWATGTGTVVDQLAGAAFGVLVGSLVFDRLRARAERQAAKLDEIAAQQVSDLRRDLWIQENASLYESLVDDLAAHCRVLIADGYLALRHRPMERAATLTGWNLVYVRDLLSESRSVLSALASAHPPRAGGRMHVATAVAEVTIGCEQLEALASLSDPPSYTPVPSLLEPLAHEVVLLVEQWQPVVQRMSAAAVELAAVHAAYEDGRLPPPELSMGQTHDLVVRVRLAVEEVRWVGRDLSETADPHPMLIANAARAVRLAVKAAAGIYDRLVTVRPILGTEALGLLDFPEGVDLISSVEASTERAYTAIDTAVSATRTVENLDDSWSRVRRHVRECTYEPFPPDIDLETWKM